MNFSFEEIYFMYGQYDQFVRIGFIYGSQAFKDYGNSIMGKFIYAIKEREELEEIIKSGVEQRTEKKVKFSPTDIDDELTTEQRFMLDKEGFLCSDIDIIWASGTNQINRFTVSGEKEIPNLMTIEINRKGFDVNNAILYLGRKRTESGPKLCPDEINQYNGTLLYEIEKKGGKIPDTFYDVDGKINDILLYYKYCAMMNERSFTEAEIEDYHRVGINLLHQRMDIIKKEIVKGGKTYKQLVSISTSYINFFFIYMFRFRNRYYIIFVVSCLVGF